MTSLMHEFALLLIVLIVALGVMLGFESNIETEEELRLPATEEVLMS